MSDDEGLENDTSEKLSDVPARIVDDNLNT